MLKLRYPSKSRRLLLGLAVGGAVFGVASAVQASIPDANGSAGESTSAFTSADFDVLARNTAVGKFAHIDVHGRIGNPCTFWWMVIPSG